MTVLYEDNHLIIVNKAAGEIVQGDKTGDETLAEAVKLYIKEKYNKPGNVFLGTVHRLDRPVSGVVVFARTSKSLARLNEMFRRGEVQKTYHCLTPLISDKSPAKTIAPNAEPITLTHYLTRNEKQNKAYAHPTEVAGSKKAVLDVRQLRTGDRLQLLEVNLHTGRHHQIRCQLSTIGFPIRGDLKYGAPRSNPDGSICLHARQISFVHPISKAEIAVTAPYPALSVWQAFDTDANEIPRQQP
ncbi:MAG: RluA family pseudouridine synthase [Bacteroidaceae bacterium]|nr:RluA family pseudouridine synthase [Bacteroidaceae bacterium]